uniref:Uncharacterized protein n=1 Tax=Acrobeloides nanus TaxID=290746 RepID=A0A914EHA8_9BILA
MKGIPKELDNLYFESHEAKRRSIVEEHQKRKSISEEQKITLKKPETNQKVPVVVAPTKDNERAANKS